MRYVWGERIFELDIVWEFMSRLLDNFRENWLSVKMPIYKEESVIESVILSVMEFWKLGDKVGEMVEK